MGAGNVGKVYGQWSGLEHRPFRALAYMALVSLDRDNPPKYWAGRDDLATALGYPMPEEPADDDQSQEAAVAREVRARGHNAVKKVTGDLVKQGALLRMRQGNFRSHAVFALLFPATEGTFQGLPTETVEGTSQGSPRGPLRGPVGDPSRVLEGTPQGSPKEYEEKEGGSEGMRGRPSAGPRPRPTLKRTPSPSSDIETERRRQMDELQKKIDGFGKGAA